MPVDRTVKYARKYLFSNQGQLTHELNVSFSTVNHWGNGKSNPISMAKDLFFTFCRQKNLESKNSDKGEV